MFVVNWIQAFTTWLRSSVGVVEKPPLPLFERKSKDGLCTLRLLANDALFPGVVSVWQLDHQEAQNDYLLILCNLAQIKESLRAGAVLEENQDWKRDFEIKAKTAIRAQSDIIGSHLFMVCAVSRKPTRHRWVNNNLEHYKPVEYRDCFVVNLQGELRQYLGANQDAARIVKAIALQLLNMQRSQFNTWEELVNAVPWLKWLGLGTRKIFGENHVLRVPRANTATSKRTSGFTLTELLVALMIAFILAAIVLVSGYLSQRDKATYADAISMMRGVVPDIEEYRLERNHYPADVNPNRVPPGIANWLPTDPNQIPFNSSFDWELWGIGNSKCAAAITFFGKNRRRDGQVYSLDVRGDDRIIILRVYDCPNGPGPVN